MRRYEPGGPAALFAAGLLLLLTGTADVSSGSGPEAGAPMAAAQHALVVSAARDAVAVAEHAEAPPPAHTGGFGEPTCVVCHAEYPLDPEGGSLTVEGLPERYEPGASYVLTVTLASGEMDRAGFEMALRHADGTQAGRLAPLDASTAVTEAGGVGYAHHTLEGSEVASPDVAAWSVEWVAPETGERVLLHATANSANGDDSPFGDLVYSVAAESHAAGGPGALTR